MLGYISTELFDYKILDIHAEIVEVCRLLAYSFAFNLCVIRFIEYNLGLNDRFNETS